MGFAVFMTDLKLSVVQMKTSPLGNRCCLDTCVITGMVLRWLHVERKGEHEFSSKNLARSKKQLGRLPARIVTRRRQG